MLSTHRRAIATTQVLAWVLGILALAPDIARAESSTPEALVAEFARTDQRPRTEHWSRLGKSLAALGEDALPALREGLTHYFPSVRHNCYDLLSKLRAPLRDLRPALKDADPMLRFRAGREFARAKDKDGIDAMVSCLLMTAQTHQRAEYARVLESLLDRGQPFDWTTASRADALREAKDWQRWWRKKRRAFNFPQKLTIARPLLYPSMEELEADYEDELNAIGKLAASPSNRQEVVSRAKALHLEATTKEAWLYADELAELASHLNRVGAPQEALALCLEATDESNRDRGYGFGIESWELHHQMAVSYSQLAKHLLARTAVRRGLMLVPDQAELLALRRTLGAR